MKRNSKTEKFKAFLRKEDELGDNWEAQRALGYKPLDKPIHNGYSGEWTLREDIARREDADVFEALITHFGVIVWCRDKTFIRWDSFEKREVKVNPSFKKINEREYENLPVWCKKYFYHCRTYDREMWGGRIEKYYTINLPDYYFKLKISKHYRTQYRVIDEVLKQEEAEIRAQLETTFYDERYKCWNDRGSLKPWKKIYNKAERSFNKLAIHNVERYLNDDDDTIHHKAEFKYRNRNGMKWYMW